MKTLPALLLFGLLAACNGKQPDSTAPAAKVASAEEIISKSSCLSCHQTGNQMKLPTWTEVADRYKENKDAETLLVTKIAKGGSGSWGKMDMPPYHPDLSETERRVVVQAILSTPTQ